MRSGMKACRDAAAEARHTARPTWVASHDVETGAAKSQLRKGAQAAWFIEATVNVLKTVAQASPTVSTLTVIAYHL